jgi:hypothetical protein
MERHGFVTFWLDLILFFNIIGMLISIFGSDLINSFYHNRTASFTLGIGTIIISISMILLLNWRILGFWLLIIDSIIQAIIMISWGYGFFSTIIQCLIPWAILWGILHLKKNGVSAWDYLTNNTRQKSTYAVNKKCRQCGIIYSGSHSSCPKCNFSLYEETNQSIDGTILPIAPINVNYGDT